jgi:hypothetical protein
MRLGRTSSRRSLRRGSEGWEAFKLGVRSENTTTSLRLSGAGSTPSGWPSGGRACGETASRSRETEGRSSVGSRSLDGPLDLVRCPARSLPGQTRPMRDCVRLREFVVAPLGFVPPIGVKRLLRPGFSRPGSRGRGALGDTVPSRRPSSPRGRRFSPPAAPRPRGEGARARPRRWRSRRGRASRTPALRARPLVRARASGGTRRPCPRRRRRTAGAPRSAGGRRAQRGVVPVRPRRSARA